MISADICAWCKHYRGLRDGWKPMCDAFPEGISCDFEADEDKGCYEDIGFEVKEELSAQYNKIFHK